MLASFVVVAAFVALGSCGLIGHHPELKLNASLNGEWAVYKERHSKKYADDSEELHRRLAWEANLKIIEQHNREYAAGLHSYTLGANNIADLTLEEYKAKYLTKYVRQRPDHTERTSVRTYPDAIDWREKGYVTPVKDQGQCGSCWAFSATGAMEGATFKKTGKLISLSEQNLVDCSVKQGNHGCNGGLMDYAFTYVIKNPGINDEETYPYEAVDGQCRFKKDRIAAKIRGYKDIPAGGETELQVALSEVGPIAVAIDAGHSSFQLYKGGVYDEPACSPEDLDHGVLAVGYDSVMGQQYYIVKNSWGTGWGISGYIWMSRNKDNQCGIATAASYPTA
jgi:cathepsin L